MDRPRRALRSNPLRAAKLKKPARATRSSVAYLNSQSPSSDNDFNNDDSDDSSVPILRKPTTTTTRRNPKRKRKSESESNHNDYSPPLKKIRRQTHNRAKENPRKAITPRTPNSTAASPVTTQSTPSSTFTWNFPNTVLDVLFEQIAAPIRDISSRREDVSQAVADLLSAARVCKAFKNYALASLYKCPPFYHQWRYTKGPYTSLSQFIDTLNIDPGKTMIPYRRIVKILRIEVGSTLTQRHGANFMNLQNVIPNLVNLTHLEFYHESDEPPYRKLDEHVRFKCALGDLRRALGGLKLDDTNRPTELKSWRWNSRLTSDKSLSLGDLDKFHLDPSFASLEKVAFVNYQLPSWGLPQRVQDTEKMQEQNRLRMDQLSACISALPKLEHLIFESCTLVNGLTLSRLPTTLKHLELITCWEVTADDLIEFLLSHGHHMQSLTINHCQSLSLAFLPVLRSACPNLEDLYMDLSYFRHHEHYADNKPEYDHLLAEDEVPTWPSSMRSIEILHMRKWTRKAAEMFFGSLIQSAPDLPNLRRLSLSVALDIAWRQRQDFREFWVDKMVRVFKRKTKSPRDPKTLRSAPTEPNREDEKEPALKNSMSARLPNRRSTRLANISPTPTSSEGEVVYYSKAQLARASAIDKELQRLRGSGKLLKERPLKEPDADDEDSEDELAADHSDTSRLSRRIRRISKLSKSDDEYIHGKCNVVNIQVDNHRPMERQFDMDDFLDSPEESDSEWDGGDNDVFG
ncbi:hypothetical protein F4776DRAFT_629748 [Hypoxylon sp. NC0597]|nr:hypothetical protein F4776DRAFT_629748 [Hypoxylon sp. NC0597]